MTYLGIEVTRMWDGYLTVTARVAAAISLNGRTPRPGHENKTRLKVNDALDPNRQVPVWVGRTTYGGIEHFWLHPYDSVNRATMA